jgi:hypothetical protein
VKTLVSAERVINAPADVVYRCLADYTRHHRPGGFLPPAFSNQEILGGGFGDGTVIRLKVSLAGRTNTMTARISEPEPGRVLVEDSQSVQTTFTVRPEADRCRVRFDTVLQAGGLQGRRGSRVAPELAASVRVGLRSVQRYATHTPGNRKR